MLINVKMFIMLINVKMLTIVGILTCISMINKTSEGLKQEKYLFFSILVFYEQLKFHALTVMLSMKKVYNLWAMCH